MPIISQTHFRGVSTQREKWDLLHPIPQADTGGPYGTSSCKELQTWYSGQSLSIHTLTKRRFERTRHCIRVWQTSGPTMLWQLKQSHIPKMLWSLEAVTNNQSYNVFTNNHPVVVVTLRLWKTINLTRLWQTSARSRLWQTINPPVFWQNSTPPRLWQTINPPKKTSQLPKWVGKWCRELQRWGRNHLERWSGLIAASPRWSYEIKY